METKQAGPFKGTMGSQQGQDPIYALGHSEEELQRLIDQSRFFGDMTEQVLINAGIERGMRVLDVGCGAGDVSFLLAKLVGSSGSVIGVDRAAEAIATARSRAQAARLENVTFSQCEIADISLEHPVDAAVGRFVLMYIYDPITMLRRIAGNVKAGGVIAFQEMDLSGIRSLPHLRLFEQGIGWLTETFRRGRIETQMGLKLRQTFLGAGLPAPEMSMAARVEGGLHSPAYEILTKTLQSLLPMMERLGVASAEEVQIETLAQRLCDETVSAGGVIVLPNLVGAWARMPGESGIL